MERPCQVSSSRLPGFVLADRLVFPPEPPVAKPRGRNGAQQSRARRGWARRSEPLTVSTVLAKGTQSTGGCGGNTFLLVGSEQGFGTAGPITAEEQTRRLITLIYAGRNRMDMIRRELPRTERAGWVRKPFRKELEEDSPFRGPCAVIGSAIQKSMGSF